VLPPPFITNGVRLFVYYQKKKNWCDEHPPSTGAFTELHDDRGVRKFLYRWQKAAISGVPVHGMAYADAVGDNPQMPRFAANMLNSQSRTADKGGPPAWGWVRC